MQKNIALSIMVSAIIIATTVYLISGSPTTSVEETAAQNVAVRDGVQYVTIAARGGYTPKKSVIESNIPTLLVVQTNGTYDCSASLVVRAVSFQKNLQPTGEEVIDLGVLKSGEEILGTCGMGMYRFEIVAS